jgi:hypothetical protein
MIVFSIMPLFLIFVEAQIGQFFIKKSYQNTKKTCPHVFIHCFYLSINEKCLFQDVVTLPAPGGEERRSLRRGVLPQIFSGRRGKETG